LFYSWQLLIAWVAHFTKVHANLSMVYTNLTMEHTNLTVVPTCFNNHTLKFNHGTQILPAFSQSWLFAHKSELLFTNLTIVSINLTMVHSKLITMIRPNLTEVPKNLNMVYVDLISLTMVEFHQSIPYVEYDKNIWSGHAPPWVTVVCIL
jgi:hypothetical protein